MAKSEGETFFSLLAVYTAVRLEVKVVFAVGEVTTNNSPSGLENVCAGGWAVVRERFSCLLGALRR